MRAHGCAAISVDILKQPWFDLNRRVVQTTLLGWITSNVVSAVWTGAPCCTWSQARRGPPGSSWCRLRSAEHVWGLPNLDSRASE
eukprot:8715538-Pyramimonas_sp.AAC.1